MTTEQVCNILLSFVDEKIKFMRFHIRKLRNRFYQRMSNAQHLQFPFTVSADGWEHSVALGSVGFSRGVHYWEFTIDKYSADTDPAFGIARIDVSRDKMLGKFDLVFCSRFFPFFSPFMPFEREPCLMLWHHKSQHFVTNHTDNFKLKFFSPKKISPTR